MKIQNYILLPPRGPNLTARIKLPRGAQILTVDVDKKDNVPKVWAVVDSNQPEEDRLLLVLAVDDTIPENEDWKSMRYISSFQYQLTKTKDILCFHIFEKSED